MEQKKIKIISNKQFLNSESFNSKDIIISEIEKPESLDTFKINIIDLRNPEIWKNVQDNTSRSNAATHLEHIREMIESSKQTQIIYIYPQNTNFKYNYSDYQKKYTKQTELKTILVQVEILLTAYLKLPTRILKYEPNKTRIKDYEIDSDFYFNAIENILTDSILSKKPTTIKLNNRILSTLAIKNYVELDNFLKNLGLSHVDQNIPDWIKNIKFYDDKSLESQMELEKNIILEAQSRIKSIKIKIGQNLKIKSIIYSNGETLVKVVFEIFENIFKCDLKTLKDNKKEDFLFDISEGTFIGEIKGVNTNVKSSYISQLDVHYQNYLENSETKSNKVIKPILIICHQRNRPLADREDIHETQIQLAIRNNSLIIDTITLLKIYELFLENKLNSETIAQLFLMKTGLLTMSDFSV